VDDNSPVLFFLVCLSLVDFLDFALDLIMKVRDPGSSSIRRFLLGSNPIGHALSFTA
jgi:hypothetical protein